jgi:hypothetical protein
MTLRIFFFLTFATCCVAGFICYWFLIHIHKTRYRNLWEKEKKNDSIWFPYERELWYQFERKTPYWVRQEKDAFVALWILRTSQYLGIASFFGFVFSSCQRFN